MLIDKTEVMITGRLLKTARLRNEYYDFVTNPADFIDQLKKSGSKADLFTFLSVIGQRTPSFPFYHEPESIAVIPITTYEHWWKNQISDKTRNMARKAGKKGVEIRSVEFNDDFVRGIMGIYNEAPVRQGKPFWHYGKSFEEMKRVHITFLETSQFIGAYLGPELIGFIKLVSGHGKASLMHILSMMAHRDKSPTNALMAKAVEICAQQNIPYLHYARWSRGGLGDFKKNHGFERVELPRYFVPLSGRGKVMLKCRLHHKMKDYLPETLRDSLVQLRARWYATKSKT